MAGLAAHVEGSVPASFFRCAHANGVTLQAEVLFFAARGRLQQLILVIRRMGIVAVEAVADRGRMDLSFYRGCVFVEVTLQAKFYWSGCDQLDMGDIAIGANLVTAQTASGDGRMDGPALGFAFMALDAFCGFGIRIKRDGVNGAKGTRQAERGCAHY
jgi:hypothetical protein